MKIEVLGNGYVTDEVSTVKPYEANLNEENRIKFVTDLAAISRGKHESANPAKRYQLLLKEAAPYDTVNDTEGSPSRPIEFLGIMLLVEIINNKVHIETNLADTVVMDIEAFINNIAKYSYMVACNSRASRNLYHVYTNMRACLNAGIQYELIPYNTAEELESFKAVRIKSPMFVFNHLVTHTALSKEARSERVTELANDDYWLPEDFRSKVYAYSNKYANMLEDEIYTYLTEELDKSDYQANMAVNSVHLASHLLSYNNIDSVIVVLTSGSELRDLDYSQEAIQIFFKEIGYPKEIYQRAMLEFRYKEFILTGWKNNPNTFKHLCVERNSRPNIWKNWTQVQTTEVVNAIDRIVFPELVLSE